MSNYPSSITKYAFYRFQLATLLESTIQMYTEYKEKYDYDDESAINAAIKEMLEGLDATIELVSNGELNKDSAGMIL